MGLRVCRRYPAQTAIAVSLLALMAVVVGTSPQRIDRIVGHRSEAGTCQSGRPMAICLQLEQPTASSNFGTRFGQTSLPPFGKSTRGPTSRVTCRDCPGSNAPTANVAAWPLSRARQRFAMFPPRSLRADRPTKARSESALSPTKAVERPLQPLARRLAPTQVLRDQQARRTRSQQGPGTGLGNQRAE